MLSLPSSQLSAEMLELTQKDLRRMKFLFDDIDIDESNEIDCAEFFEMLGEKRSGGPPRIV